MQKYIDRIISSQNPAGHWIFLSERPGKRVPALSFSYGNSGITWFLLEYGARFDDLEVRKVALNALARLSERASQVERELRENGFRKTMADPFTRDCSIGIALACIKAYETVGESRFKEIAEKMLMCFPPRVIHENFALDGGMAGLGELYLEGFRVFRNEEWLTRADWVAGFLTHTYRRTKAGGIYWLSNNAAHPTADLMIGNSGIIYFLIRYLNQDTMGYHLLA
ncbi:MAG TPA: lanthionine synthetase LanC family protein [Mucilaginibacter sp.]|nr:lanthionine synthetase LanC family protein [Mucilaginibacter sp.]